jgi:hypothetical protein
MWKEDRAMKLFKFGFLAALAGAAALATAAHATPITYVFTPDASVTLGHDKETIAGSVTYDYDTGDTLSVDFVLTGASPFGGHYDTFAAGTLINALAGGELAAFNDPDPAEEIGLFFFQGLQVNPDPLISPDLLQASGNLVPDIFVGCPCVSVTAATGGLELPGSAVPEPSTWTMMLVGFGAAGFMIRRRSGRKQSAPAVA